MNMLHFNLLNFDTLDNLNAFYCPPPEEDVISPVELCIRTK